MRSPLRHIDIVEGKLDRDDIRAFVVDRVNYLRKDKLWGPDDPLFPMTKVTVGPDLRFTAAGFDRKHWSSAGPIHTIFREAFTAAGLPYFNPHSFRNTLALLGGDLCEKAEHYKAWSQNSTARWGSDDLEQLWPLEQPPAGRDHAVICQSKPDRPSPRSLYKFACLCMNCCSETATGARHVWPAATNATRALSRRCPEGRSSPFRHPLFFQNQSC